MRFAFAGYSVSCIAMQYAFTLLGLAVSVLLLVAWREAVRLELPLADDIRGRLFHDAPSSVVLLAFDSSVVFTLLDMNFMLPSAASVAITDPSGEYDLRIVAFGDGDDRLTDEGMLVIVARNCKRFAGRDIVYTLLRPCVYEQRVPSGPSATSVGAL